MMRKPDDEGHHHAVPEVEVGDLVPGPSAQADDQYDTLH